MLNESRERRQMEKEIIAKMVEIVRLYERYNPDDDYLTMYWINGKFYANNSGFSRGYIDRVIDVSYNQETHEYFNHDLNETY